MNKRLFRVVLILVIAVILFAGCNNFIPPTEDPTTPAEDPTTPAEDPTTPAEDPTTLEGTWRGVKYDQINVYKVEGEEVHTETNHEDFPLKRTVDKDLGTDFTNTIHAYLQIESKFRSFSKNCFNNIPQDLEDKLPSGDFFLLDAEAEYSVTENKITITFDEENSFVLNFNINENDLTTISESTLKDWFWWDPVNKKIKYFPAEGLQPCILESKVVTIYTKVSDSEVGELLNLEDYPELVKLYPPPGSP